MKAIILAAGYATRLYPLTLETPKPLLTVGNKKMIEHIIERIEEVEDIDEIVVVTNNKFYSHFLEWRKFFASSKEITILNDGTVNNEDRLGAVGDIDFAIKKLKINDDILIVGGDNLFEFSLPSFMRFFKKKKASIVGTIDLQSPEKLAKRLGAIEVDKSLKIIGFEEKPEKPKTSIAATCIYLFTKEDIKELERCIKENKKPDNTGDFIKYLAAKKPVYSYIFAEGWFDIGSHEQLKEAHEIYLKKKQ